MIKQVIPFYLLRAHTLKILVAFLVVLVAILKGLMAFLAVLVAISRGLVAFQKVLLAILTKMTHQCGKSFQKIYIYLIKNDCACINSVCSHAWFNFPINRINVFIH